jgi:hypothetical protein
LRALFDAPLRAAQVQTIAKSLSRGPLRTMLPKLPDRRPAAGRTRPARLEVCPPQRNVSMQDWLSRVKGWLATGWPGTQSRAESRCDPALALAAARQDFLQAVADIDLPPAATLLDQIEFARSMRELWHLRAEVFALVSMQRNQHEADQRLAALNRHFRTRAPRSGFGGLTSKHMWP